MARAACAATGAAPAAVAPASLHLAQLALPPDLGDWQPLLGDWAGSDAGRATLAAVAQRIEAGATVYPPQPWRAFQLTPAASVKVLILGQDPYHGPGQAEGLAFSVPPGQRPPPSLRNILREVQRDTGLPLPAHGSLRAWAQRGVLLLNTALTVEQGAAGSHARLGWQQLAGAVLQRLLHDPAPKVLLLWGGHAQALARDGLGLAGQPAARKGPHLLLCCNHPSPLSARRGPLPFVGCGHFGQADRFLQDRQRGGMDWSLG